MSKFNCNKCQKSYIRKPYLDRHVRTHSEKNPNRCKYCPKVFAHSTNREVHERIHTGEKPFKCSECPKSFVQITNLNNHMRHHTGEKPYQCSKCYKQFVQLTSLKNHERTHTGEKPYKCDLCSKCFTQPANLYEHVKTYHDSSKNNSQKVEILYDVNEKINFKKEPSDEVETRDLVNKAKMINFTPFAYWYCCRICKVCIEDEDKFVAHKRNKHPNSVDPSVPLVDLVSDSSEDRSSSSDSEDNESLSPSPKRQKFENNGQDEQSNTEEFKSGSNEKCVQTRAENDLEIETENNSCANTFQLNVVKSNAYENNLNEGEPKRQRIQWKIRGKRSSKTCSSTETESDSDAEIDAQKIPPSSSLCNHLLVKNSKEN